MDYKLTVHYYLRTDKINVKELSPIYLRITLNGKRIDISTSQCTIPENWNKYSERVKGNKEDVRILNNYLDELLVKVNKHFNSLVNSGNYFDVNDLKNRLTGKSIVRKTLLQVFDENNTEIADICGIEKNLTCHIARHTFATTVTLTNGVPIKTVSKMLGHKNLQTTQIYSKVIDKKIAEDMGALKKKMTG